MKRKMSYRKKLLSCSVALAVMGFINQASAAPGVVTEFSMTGEQGSISIAASGLSSSLDGLLSGNNIHYYNTQIFSPTATDQYVIGTSQAQFDTVLILYDGVFDPNNPHNNALLINDDSSGAQNNYSLSNAGSCGATSFCSEVTASLTAGVNYTVVTTTFGTDIHLTGDVWYYVIGPEQVIVGDSVSVYNASVAMLNNPAYGAATVIDATPELLALFSDANLSTDTELSVAASQTLPLLVGSSVIVGGQSLIAINKVVNDRIGFNSGMSSGSGFIGDKHIWLKPFGSWADQNDRKGVSGYETETVGMVFGTDGELNERTRLGAAFAYANSNVDGGTSAAPQSVDAEVFQLIGYGSYSFNDSMVANFQLDFGKNNVDGNRTIDFTNTVAKSDYNSHSLHIGVGLDKGYNLGAVDTLVASVRADYTKIKDDAYNETGAGLLNLNVESNTAEIFVVGVDGTLNHSLSDKSVLQANIGLGYDLNNDDVVITAAFEGSPAASFDAQGLEQDPWIANAGLSYIHQAENGIEVQLTYDVQYREDFLNQSASLKARWAF